MKKKDEQKRKLIIAGVLVGAGILIGVKLQRKIDMKMVGKLVTLRPEPNPMSPEAMSIPEIKEVLSKIEGAQFFDALVTNVNGVQHLFIR